MTLQDFINKYNGQSNVGNTTDNKGQCVGLVMVWLKDTLGNPHIWGHAKDLMANADISKYDVIWNTPDGVPQRGDVINWNGRMGGGFGHTAIVTRADLNTFEVFEQNTNPKSCHIATYANYNNVQGWIRPKNIKESSEMMQIDKTTFENLVTKSTAYDNLLPEHERVSHLLSENERVNREKDQIIADLRQEVAEARDERDQANKAVVTLNSKIEDLTSAINKDAVEDQDIISKNLDLEKKVKELEEEKVAPIEPVIEHYESIIEELWKNIIRGKRVQSWRERFWKWIA